MENKMEEYYDQYRERYYENMGNEPVHDECELCGIKKQDAETRYIHWRNERAVLCRTCLFSLLRKKINEKRNTPMGEL